MFSGESHTLKSASYYGRAKSIALAHGWVTVSLIQRHLRLGYGFSLSLVHRLESQGVVSPIDATGRRLVLFDAEYGLCCAREASKTVSPLQCGININLSMANQKPLSYQLVHDKVEYDIVLMPSQHRCDNYYSEKKFDFKTTEVTTFARYFFGKSQHGKFEVLVQCLRLSVDDPFEVKNITVVTKPKNVRITQLPSFSVVGNRNPL